jgi:hypothetical protein
VKNAPDVITSSFGFRHFVTVTEKEIEEVLG